MEGELGCFHWNEAASIRAGYDAPMIGVLDRNFSRKFYFQILPHVNRQVSLLSLISLLTRQLNETGWYRTSFNESRDSTDSWLDMVTTSSS
jgi:hypothetical protein